MDFEVIAEVENKKIKLNVKLNKSIGVCSKSFTKSSLSSHKI